ncbi:MAG: 50S ribosome-binding GTPase [Candidatus Scalindua rubra]|uniref:tRNA modification GTPase MnmE n=1 Tax=Candidatus Scalindua brodae TaxID=237368 RepID=A0A0B0EN45_9BACT|nr:MAG: tRNA modification GTPase [Candidatus Scalindua brodae]MBZ0110542.1 50S ribosome-binding GTPase [Candidatus Scalindua rubra]TWU30782.1 tRNA modification GTPase MnmE [Candidatus Brocadiaceae bacterium S225]
MKKETIASITTPIGEGGIGVIQVSGPDSLEIVNTVFKGKKQKDLRNAESKRLYYGDICSNGSIVDEVIVNVLREQDSFTGEDLVEVNCHGGILAIKKTLECVVSAGANEVHWKELVNRPLINSKIDRIQEEALLEIPEARTKLGVKVLLDQYNGALSAYIHKIIEKLEKCDKNKEQLYDNRLSFNSPQDDVTLSEVEVLLTLNSICIKLKEILATAAFGCAITSPQKLIITGKPNAGKSTLINALLKEDRLITHEEPGTTRDAVDEMISISSIPFTIIDTAGIRETDHEVEKLGVLESKKQLRLADKIIIVFDNSKPAEKEDKEIVKFIDELKLQKTDNNISIFPVLNKADLPCKLDMSALVGKTLEPIYQVSALQGDGLSVLEENLISEFKEFIEYTPERPVIFTKRQKEYVSNALNILTQYIQISKDEKDSNNCDNLLNGIKQNLLNCIDDSHHSKKSQSGEM